MPRRALRAGSPVSILEVHPMTHAPIVRRAAGFLLLALTATGCRKASGPTSAEAAPRPVRVETAEVRVEPMPRTLALTGSLRGKRQTDLAANAMGRVIETFVERGVEVKQGDLLARLDTRAAALTAAEAQASASLAKSQESIAKRECERYKALFDQGAISQADYDRTADQCKNTPLSVAAAEARARSAAQVVGDGQIRAPFGGLVTERFVEAGQYVRQDTKVVSLVSIDTLRLEFTVPEARLAAVKAGGALSFTVPAYPGRTFSAAVRHVGGAVREATRDLVAEAEVDNPDRALRPGMFASIELLTGEEPAPVVPREALLAKEGRSHVFVVVDRDSARQAGLRPDTPVDRRLEERVVQVGAARGDLVAVARGVRPGDRLVLKPSETLQNGQAVE
jgi:membrane fusion protein (multidrug efflux system)